MTAQQDQVLTKPQTYTYHTQPIRYVLFPSQDYRSALLAAVASAEAVILRGLHCIDE